MMQQGGPQPVQPSAGGQHGQKLELFHQANVKGNAMIAMHTRILAALVAGIATGILGVTGYMGFLIFFASQLLNAALLYLKCSGKPGRYFTSSASVFFSGLLSQVELLTFVLFWTLSNNLVYLF